MSASSVKILLVWQGHESSLVSSLLKSVFFDAVVRVEDNAATIAQLVSKTPPDIIVVDWAISTLSASDLCQILVDDTSDNSSMVVAIVHDPLECSKALSIHVHHVIDLSEESHAEHILRLNLTLLRRCEDLRVQNKSLQHSLHSKELGEKQIIRALQKTIAVRFPEAADRTPFISNAVEWIVDQFSRDEISISEKEQILIASQLAWLGKMHLPDSKKNDRVTLDGAPTSDVAAFVPLQADHLLEGVDALTETRAVLKNMYENYDGTGFPDRKQHWQIPLGSRILRAVYDLDEISRSSRLNMAEALEQLKRFNRHVYDHRIVALLEEYVLNVSRRSRDHAHTRAVQLFDLHEGMTLASDIVTNSGLKLMNAGTILREQLIKRIQSHNAMDPILGNIYVQEK